MNKKNKILFFLFSLIPGAAHMYIGLVKRGLVIMLAFVAGAGLAMMADTPAFLLVLPVLWFYSFFDAWNKYHLPEDKLAKVQDDFLFFLNGMPQNMRSDPRFKKVASASVLKIGGIAAVIVGAYLLWDKIIVNVLSRLLSETGAGILSEVSYRLPQVAVAVLLIVIGVKLITHKSASLTARITTAKRRTNNMAAKRVGSVTFGLTLVVFGVMFLLSAFIKSFNYLDVIKFWPVIFISLGIEMLVHAFSKDAEKAKLDVPSCIMTCVLMLFQCALPAHSMR